MLFPLMCAFMVKATRYTLHGELTKADFLYSELLVDINGRLWSGARKFNPWMVSVRKTVNRLMD